MKAGDEIDNSVGDDARLGAELDRGLFGGFPFTVSGDEMPRDCYAGNVGEGVKVFGLFCVVHGWNKIGFSGKLDESAVGVDLVCELARCPGHRVIHNGGVHVVAVFESVCLPFESLER